MQEKGSKYKTNLITLRFKNDHVRDEFNRSIFMEDLYALRFVILMGIILSAAFIVVDIYKYENPWISIIFRGGMAILLALFGYLSLLIKPEKYWLTQYYGVSISLIVIIGFYFHYHFNDDPKFDIFLPNILTIMVYVIATITGLRYRYGFIVISLALIGYFIYIPTMNPSPIAMRQITQLVVVYVFSVLSSYVLERQKINLFINKAILAEEKTKVDSLGAVRNKLFSIISHDLRGPIVSLKGIVSLINKDALSQEEFKGLSTNLEEKLNQTSYLMDNLLAWSKSQMNGLVVQKVPLSLKEEALSVVERFSQDFKKKNLQIETSFSGALNIHADKEMLQIVIRNILSNAIKFTPEYGEIKIEGFDRKDQVHLFIKDNGSGISKEKLNHLFEIKQNNVIGNVHFEGAGIGLLLVKEFTELNGGKVSCESTLGTGTQFILKFPKHT